MVWPIAGATSSVLAPAWSSHCANERRRSLNDTCAIFAAIAFLLATYYLFTMYRYVFLGAPGTATETFEDLTLRERVYLLPVVACLLSFGVYPKPLLDLVRPTVLSLLSTVK